ncbi:hypothetical protein [Deinococcus sp.]|uniref:hypothetical protein n=1 Tax=Deinococcus sp. TaxID=47478 RepID=UPI0025C4BDD0|nr:hypothetical protein [Deinococcus sp.]
MSKTVLGGPPTVPGLTLLTLTLLTLVPVQALSGKGAFVLGRVIKSANLRPAPYPGKLGNQHTRCALSGESKATVQNRLSHYKGWKRTDPWKAGSTGFTSDGIDQYVVTVMNKIGSKHGTLIIFSEL